MRHAYTIVLLGLSTLSIAPSASEGPLMSGGGLFAASDRDRDGLAAVRRLPNSRIRTTRTSP